MQSDQKNTFKIAQFNVENLFLYLDQYKGQNLKKINENEWQALTVSTTPNKPLNKVFDLAQIMSGLDVDLFMLNEVGGLESLENFSRYFLNDEWIPLLKEGNSRRGIDVGYLLRKNSSFKPLLISHKDRPINFLYAHEQQTPSGGKSHYFSRDVAELRLFKPQSTSPYFVILLTHLKSKLDSERIDFEGRKRRAAELKSLTEIYLDVKKELAPETGIIVCGDFNGHAARNQTEPEFHMLHNTTDLIDVFDISELDPSKRFTQIQITPSGQQQFLQLDYIFVSSNMQDNIISADTKVHHFFSRGRDQFLAPRNMEERGNFASDHFPVICTIKMT